jgi:Bacterial dnaA protein helix-turn-helix
MTLPLPTIVTEVAAYFHVSEKKLRSPDRHTTIVRARQAACYLARRHCKETQEEIGRELNRDHTTVMHACRVIEAEMLADPELFDQMNHLDAKLRKMAMGEAVNRTLDLRAAAKEKRDHAVALAEAQYQADIQAINRMEGMLGLSKGKAEAA